MLNYQKLYAILCGAISDALDLLPPLPENAKGLALLENAILETEAQYIESAESCVTQS